MSQVMYLCDQDSTKLSDKYYLNKLSGTAPCGLCGKAESPAYEFKSKYTVNRRKPPTVKRKAQYREKFRDW